MRSGWVVGAVVAAGLVGAAPAARGQAGSTPNTLKLEKSQASPKAKVADLAWLTGRWVGEFMGGRGEEIFAPPEGDTMIGMFRLVRDGKIVFSELIYIVEEEGSLVLKLKHFDRELKGWEEKDVVRAFPLVKRTESEAYFDGITYRKEGPDGMRFFVAVRQKNGEIQELEGRHKKVGLN
ncbi:MAG: DUF6265 family protein [Thermoanaerobaculia bacterium]